MKSFYNRLLTWTKMNTVSFIKNKFMNWRIDCLKFLEFLLLNLKVNTVDRTSLNKGLKCASNGFWLYLYIVNICFVISFEWILFIRGKPR